MTIGDLIQAVTDDKTAVAADTAAVTSANTQLASDTEKLAADTTALGAAIKATGGVFAINPDGTATAYEPDGNGGVKLSTLLPATTAVPA